MTVALVIVASCSGSLEILATNEDDQPYTIQDTLRPDWAWLLPPGETRRLTTDRLSLHVLSADCTIAETISVYKNTRLNVGIDERGEVTVVETSIAPSGEHLQAASVEPCADVGRMSN